MMAEALPGFWQRLLHTRIRDVVRGQIDGSLDWRVAVARAGLPDEIADTIARVIRQTRLFRSEKADVAEELINHFQEGLTAGRSVDELITAFGDVRLTAWLIRRSKRRCRSLPWHAAYWTSLALITAGVLYLLTAVWFLFDRPHVSTNYIAMLNQRNTSLDESDRAWPLYMEAFTTLVAEHDPAEVVRDDTTNRVSQAIPEHFSTYVELNDVDRHAANIWLVEHAEFLKLLRAAAAKPSLGLNVGQAGDYAAEYRALFGLMDSPQLEASSHPLQQDLVFDIMLPHVQSLREGASLLAADMRRAASAGDGETALADFRAMLGIAKHCGDSPLFVSALIEWHIIQLACRELETIVLDRAEMLNDEQLQNVAHSLAAHQFDLASPMRGERIAFLDLMQRLYTDDGSGDGRITAEGIRALDRWVHGVYSSNQDGEHSSGVPRPLGRGLLALGMPAINAFVASRAEMVAEHDALWRAAERKANRPLWEVEVGESIESLIHQLERKRIRYAPLALMFPAIHVARYSMERVEGFRDGALIGLALELYRRENERWPDSLQELAPRHLPTVPVDRINGGPLAYRIVDGRPLVYGLGIDGDDDKGLLPTRCRGDKFSFQVGPPSERADDAADGDWVLWGTPTER